MIEVSTLAQTIMNDPYGSVRYVRVESWRAGVLLADDVPITAGREDVDRTARIPERVSLTVPREYDGTDWSPTSDDHPLAAKGQRLRVMLGIGLQGMDVEWIQRGEFLINETTRERDAVRVEAVGLLALVDEARLVAPYQPTGTLKSTLRGLIEPALTVVFDVGLVDRAVPSGINYDEDRLGAVQELLDAWPAEARVTETGYLYVEPPVTSPEADIAISSSNRISESGISTRDGAHNCVVARGTTSDGGQVQGTAYVTTGAQRYPGPFSPLPVPEYFASPLLTTVAQCQAAARTRRDKMVRETGEPLVAEVLPLMYVQAGDVALLTDDDDQFEGYATVEQLSLPYTAGDGTMKLTMVKLPS